MGCSMVTHVNTVKSNESTYQDGNVEQNNSEDVLNQFTVVEKKIIRRTWKLLANDLTGRGSSVFLKIFLLNPHVKELFPFKQLDGETLIKSQLFRGHASRFMQAVGAVVDNIDNPAEALSPLLIELGQKHAHYSGFMPDYFNYYEDAMLEEWSEQLGNRLDDDAKEAWRKVFRFILLKLREGTSSG